MLYGHGYSIDLTALLLYDFPHTFLYKIRLKQKEVTTVIVTSFLCIFSYIYCLTNVFSMFSTHSLFQAVDYHFIHVETQFVVVHIFSILFKNR